MAQVKCQQAYKRQHGQSYQKEAPKPRQDQRESIQSRRQKSQHAERYWRALENVYAQEN